MKTILFLAFENSSRFKYLVELIDSNYQLDICYHLDEAVTKLDEGFENYCALIVETPSQRKYVNKLINHLEKKNGYMLSIPLIILSDEENAKKDEKYLSDTVVGIIIKGESEKIVTTRIENCIKFMNSTSFEEFSEILKALPSLIYLKDAKGRYAFSTQHWHHFWNGDSSYSIRGKTDLDIRKNKNNALIAIKSDNRVVSTGRGQKYVIKEESDEGVDYLEIVKEPIKNKDGEVTGIIALINNVTDQEVLRQELRIKSITDPLTGLFNRVYFKEFIEKYDFKHSSIISVDCDGLKDINDRYGHGVGDDYICFAADLLKKTLPKDSTIFRMGGDEFIAIVPNLNKESAAKYVDRLMEDASRYQTDQFVLRISAGSYTVKRTDDNIDMCIANSDAAMYKAKKKRKKK